MSRQLQYNATLVERRDLTPDLAIFVVRPDTLPEGDWFAPGQYVVFGLNPENDTALDAVERPITMASAAQERDRVEFLIRRIAHPDSETPLTHRLWAMPAGARMHVRPKPAGRFSIERIVDDAAGRAIVCVASDTGLAPFVSLVRTMRRRNPPRPLDHVAVLHGVVKPDELAFRDELTRMQQEARLTYVPCVTAPPAESGWTGHVGTAEDFFAPPHLDELEARLGLDRGGLCPDTAVVLACGLGRAIASSIERLLARGFVPDHRRIRKALEVPPEVAASFFFEQFDFEPMFQLKDAAVTAALRARFRSGAQGPDGTV